MKYLKTYENSDKIPKLDKYLIWLVNNTEAYFNILENTNKIEWNKNLECEILVVKHLYNYNIQTDTINKPGKSETSGLIINDGYNNLLNDNVKKFLVYQSNNLQDCIDMVKILPISTKFNI